jgi:hypothetical protein
LALRSLALAARAVAHRFERVQVYPFDPTGGERRRAPL